MGKIKLLNDGSENIYPVTTDEAVVVKYKDSEGNLIVGTLKDCVENTGGIQQSAVTSVNGQIGAVIITLNDLEGTSQESFNELNLKVLNIGDSVTSQGSDIEKNTTSISNLQTTVNTLNNSVNTNTNNISSLSSRTEIAEIDISNLETSIGNIQNNASTALAKASAAETTVSQQSSIIQNITNQIGDLEVAADRHDDDISNLQTNVANKANTSDVYTQTQVDNIISSSISSVYKYKGTVNTTDDLPNSSSAETGHVYYVNDIDLNYAFDGNEWKPLAGIINLSGFVDNTTFTTELAKKADTTIIPTKVSDLENDSEHVTKTEVEAMLSTAGVGAVTSINGQYGNVVLTAEMLGAVTSINGKGGSMITLTANDVGAATQNDINTVLNDYYTKTEVDLMFGDISSILNEINGESV